MEDDLLEPDVPADAGRIEEEDRSDDVADVDVDALRADEVPGIEGEEHLGLTPPG